MHWWRQVNIKKLFTKRFCLLEIIPAREPDFFSLFDDFFLLTSVPRTMLQRQYSFPQLRSFLFKFLLKTCYCDFFPNIPFPSILISTNAITVEGLVCSPGAGCHQARVKYLTHDLVSSLTEPDQSCNFGIYKFYSSKIQAVFLNNCSPFLKEEIAL